MTLPARRAASPPMVLPGAVLDEHAVGRWQGRRPGGVGADEVALDDVAGVPAVDDARRRRLPEITSRRRRRSCRRSVLWLAPPPMSHAVVALGKRSLAAGVGADEVALDHVVGGARAGDAGRRCPRYPR